MSPIAPSGKKKNAAPRLYLDYAAGAPLSPAVAREMARAQKFQGNPSSLYEEGRAARSALENARARVARALCASPGEIVFTGSGSEADALAVCGGARHTANVTGKRHIVVSSIEHKAVLTSAETLAREGFGVTHLAPDREGLVSPEALARALRPDTVLVSVMYANNEIGTIEPIAELVKTARKKGPRALFHTDACQAPGQLPLDVRALGVDLMSVNASKAYGPKGVGALYVREGVLLLPVVGGEQERGLRGGTESVALAAGLAAALEESEALRAREAPRLARLRDLLIAEVETLVPGAVLHGSREERLPNNVHFSFPGVEGEAMLLMLDRRGIACATGSACNSLSLAPSHVLLAIGEEPGLCHGSVRMTLGRATSKTDVLRAARELAEVVAHLRSISALTVGEAKTSRAETLAGRAESEQIFSKKLCVLREA